MKVKVIKNYYDSQLKENKTANKDIIDNLSEKRAKELVDAGVGEIVEEKPKEVKIETTKAEDKEEKKETAKLVETKIKKSIKKK